MKESIVYTNDNCIGCNKCIKVCSAIGACVSREERDKAHIVVDGSKCVACGSCIDVCEHNAREFLDDTDRFFEDLRSGEKISVLLAPAFKANYPDEYEKVLGGLRELGVNRIISVSFGADITTWGYINYMEKYGFAGGISQPCPALVAYVERYLPGLIPKLFPVQSPLMCAAVYARKELGITDRFAFISPCIAKKMEIDDEHNAGLVQYNVTFDHLMKYVRANNLAGNPEKSEIEYGLGSYYPTPGGLAENVRWFLGDQVFIRQVEGEKHLYEWLHRNEKVIGNGNTPFLFIDALNCKNGCICGTAVDPERADTDEALYNLLRIREEVKKEQKGNAWSRSDTPKERLEAYNKQFENLRLEDYLRGYTDRSESCGYVTPSEEELDEIFLSMNKRTGDSRNINCTCCGYDSCRQMAYAIYNGFNHRENCIYYEKTMVHELELEKEIAQHATEAKSNFLANMSHEIRTPINAVLGMDELILRESEEDNIREYALNIQRSGNMLLSLVNNILDFSKIEAGRMEIEPERYDFGALIRDIVDITRPRAESKGIKLYTEVDGSIPRYLFGDPVRIKQCISNILTNAVKYTSQGYVKLSIRLIAFNEGSATIEVSVEDTGIGIREKDIERLFTAFERIDVRRNRTVEGTGLGMNIVQSLLALMDSKLNVKSVYGEGSLFNFELEQEVLAKEVIGDINKQREDGHESYAESYIAPHARILMVDDAEMNLKVGAGLLKKTQIQVDTAHSGEEALKKIEGSEYDVLLIDHMMPEMDGIELFHRIKQLEDNANSVKPCIILTANAISGAREYYMNEGFDDYMSKPLNGKALERLLAEYIPDEKLIYKKKEPDAEDEVPERYRNLDGIDAPVGIRNCGSVDGYRSALGIFYDTIEAKADEIDDLYNKKDYKDYTIRVHALKSSARIIGAEEFASKAQELENAGKAGDTLYIKSNHDGFISGYRHYLDVLKHVCAKEQDGEPVNDGSDNDKVPVADEYIMKEVYRAVRQAAENMDIDAIEDALGELKGYRLSDTDAEVIGRIQSCCDTFDYDGIISTIY